MPNSELPPSNPVEPDEKADLARYRSQLALDRTMLAWVRTTLSMVSFGFGTVAFFRTLYHLHPEPETHRLHVTAVVFGLALLAIGLLAMALAGQAQRADIEVLIRGQVPRLRQWPLTLTVTLLLLVLGVLGFISLLVL